MPHTKSPYIDLYKCANKTQTTEISIVTNDMKFMIVSDNRMRSDGKGLLR